MRKLRYAIAVGLTLVATGPIASSPSQPAGDLCVCGSNATDIVVTDRGGVVLETWRGGLRPGDTVRLGPARLTPANALPWEALRLRPDRLSGFYCNLPPCETIAIRGYYDSSGVSIPHTIVTWPTAPDFADTELRLVLFLRNEVTTGGGAVWMPADGSGRSTSFCFSGSVSVNGCRIDNTNCNCDFKASMAIVEVGRVLMFQQPVPGSRDSHHGDDAPCGPPSLVPVARELNHFKKDVQAIPTSPWNPINDPKYREFTPTSQATVAGFSSPPLPAPKK